MVSRSVDDPRIALLKELSDPLRLRVIDRLGHAGPATVSRLAAELGVPLPQLSNHLRRLRDAGLVSVRRSGRQAIYELADPGLEQLLPLLDSITGRVLAEASPETSAPRVPSRTCYEHLGGEIGVAIYRGLRERDALRPRADGIVEYGPSATETFGALGVDVEALKPGRQRLAFECLDSTERAPHLAGALGDAVAGALLRRRWISRKPGGRVIEPTPSGRKGLRETLGIALSRA
ncbi:MAG TPA: metalloregulator ArsR/SmtB family transcription factor [Solirubrobacteraceae bacterium]|nr:metalloregulator ArsR/SmtB family transcription factor [Solirubrobacteraceae bacterium]